MEQAQQCDGSNAAQGNTFDNGIGPDGLDFYQRDALAALGRSVRAAGDTILTVAGWPEPHARQAHIDGALRCARVSGAAVEALTGLQMIKLGPPSPEFFEKLARS